LEEGATLFEDIQINIEGGLDFPLTRLVGVRQKFDTQKLNDLERLFLRSLNMKPSGAKLSLV
jgi:hypothetical protein